MSTPAICPAARADQGGSADEGMLALRWHARCDLRLDRVARPAQPGPGQVLLAVDAAGICGTDIEEWQHGPFNIPTRPHPLSGRMAPLVLGHESVGHVVTAGVRTTLGEGMRVAVEANTGCGQCPWCLRGQVNLCPELSSKGLSDDGGLAEYILVPEAMCQPVPEQLDIRAAVLSEPLAVGVHALRRGGIDPSAHDRDGPLTLVVLGGGTVGQLLAQVAARCGTVVLVEPHGQRRNLAVSAGIEHAVAPATAQATLDGLTGGRRADVCFECSGSSGALDISSRLTRRGGHVVLVGVNSEPIGLSPLDVIWREQALVGTLSHTMADFATAIDLLAAGIVRTDGLVTDLLPLSSALQAFEQLKDHPGEHLKTVLIPPSSREIAVLHQLPGAQS